jgi:glycosyltransferase involved in cell wall biosynthesis
VSDVRATIAVPFYNEAPYLRETLAALRAVPREAPVRFFLSDNCSTDGSTEIAQEIVADDERFTLHRHQRNVGAHENFRFTFEVSTSEYFMWLGAHDVIDPSYPAAAIATLDGSPATSFAAADPWKFVGSPRLATRMRSARYEHFDENRLLRYLESVSVLSNCTVVQSMFRRAFLADFEWRCAPSWDHVAISHILWHGRIRYTEGHRYLRRFFETRETDQAERLVAPGAELQWSDLFSHYTEDFRRLYTGPKDLEDYLVIKLVSALEERFGSEGLEPGRSPGRVRHIDLAMSDWPLAAPLVRLRRSSRAALTRAGKKLRRIVSSRSVSGR